LSGHHDGQTQNNYRGNDDLPYMTKNQRPT
jgi:hypothetical protein